MLESHCLNLKFFSIKLRWFCIFKLGLVNKTFMVPINLIDMKSRENKYFKAFYREFR